MVKTITIRNVHFDINCQKSSFIQCKWVSKTIFFSFFSFIINKVGTYNTVHMKQSEHTW